MMYLTIDNQVQHNYPMCAIDVYTGNAVTKSGPPRSASQVESSLMVMIKYSKNGV